MRILHDFMISSKTSVLFSMTFHIINHVEKITYAKGLLVTYKTLLPVKTWKPHATKLLLLKPLLSHDSYIIKS